MDNNFYETKRKKKSEKKKNAMTTVISVQLVLSLLISGVLFGICKTDTNLSENIKQIYSEISKRDIAASTIISTFKNVVKQTFSPSVQNENSTEDAQGETSEETSGEKAVFSPVFLTVKLQDPLEEGNITSHFGYRVSPITQEYSLHRGLDIAAPENTRILSVYDGVVEKAEYNEVNGNYLIMKHSDTLKTSYSHCNRLKVKTGDKVKKGECIALVGKTGYATGNHLHFEVLVNNKNINPLWVLKNDF